MLRGISRLLLAAVAVLIFISAAFAQSPAIDKGLSWIASAQNPDKSWGTAPFPLVIPLQATTETVLALETFDTLSQASNDGVGWLTGQSIADVAFLAGRIVARASSGLDTTADLGSILSMRNAEGLWGTDEESQGIEILDTTLAVQAVKSANYSDLSLLSTALAYLVTSQNADGGWGFVRGNESNVYMTAVVSSTLQQFPQMTTIATAVGKASSYLISQQNADGGFGNSPSKVHETALAYVALVGDGRTQGSPLQNAVNFLTSTQSSNGSWNDDPYSTALALRALHFSENKPAPPPPPPPGGSITGTVIDSVTMARVGGVAVVLGGNPLVTTTTDSSGNFTLSDVPPGAQTVSFSLSGYASKTASAGVAVDTVTNLGYVQLLSSYSTGTIAGIIRNAEGKPLAEVVVTVAGAWSGNAVTGADGSYCFSRYVTIE